MISDCMYCSCVQPILHRQLEITLKSLHESQFVHELHSDMHFSKRPYIMWSHFSVWLSDFSISDLPHIDQQTGASHSTRLYYQQPRRLCQTQKKCQTLYKRHPNHHYNTSSIQ